MSRIKTLLFVVTVILISNVTCIPRVDPLVNTNVGLIRGLRATDGDYSMFLGIPYASVNASNPFGASIPYPEFNEIFVAYDDSAICPQVYDFSDEPVGNLDCLHINIYVPNSAISTNKMNVLVWIHGGGFNWGVSGRYLYGPQFLVQHDVILVTFNYRLGAYGFMCLDHPEIPGNQGLKDQLLALNWIKNNIESFGGNADEITIFGESAGAASVDFHILYSDHSLFNKAIIQSGTSLSHWSVTEPDRLSPVKLANHLGFLTDNIEDALDFLSTADTSLMIAATIELDLLFRPCQESSYNGVVPFIAVHPINIEDPRVRDIPVLIGYNDDEGLVTMYQSGARSTEIYAQLQDTFDFNEEYLEEMEEIVKHFYLGDNEISDSTLRQLTDYYSDFQFGHPTIRSIEKYLDNDAKAIYHYVFSYTGERNFKKNSENITEGGAAHADEIGYLFQQAHGSDPSPQDQVFIDRLTTMWTNFVKYGNPTPQATDLLPVIWPPVTDKNELTYLSIGEEITVESRYNHARMAFWDLFYKTNSKYIRALQSEE